MWRQLAALRARKILLSENLLRNREKAEPKSQIAAELNIEKDAMALTALPPAAFPARTMTLLLALLLLLDGTAAAAPPTAPGDVKALCDLYFATAGANWTHNDGFSTCNPNGTASSDPCGGGWRWDNGYSGEFNGVRQCDTTGQSSRVAAL